MMLVWQNSVHRRQEVVCIAANARVATNEILNDFADEPEWSNQIKSIQNNLSYQVNRIVDSQVRCTAVEFIISFYGICVYPYLGLGNTLFKIKIRSPASLYHGGLIEYQTIGLTRAVNSILVILVLVVDSGVCLIYFLMRWYTIFFADILRCWY